MKCPFLIKRTDVFDGDGKKIGEKIDIQECIKNECMVYDGSANLCSLLSSNMKTSILIDNLKAGIKEIKDEMDQRLEALGASFASSVETMQGAVLDRFAIFRKQNEVMVLGIDRLSEMLSNKLGELKSGFGDFNNNIATLQDLIGAIKGANLQLSEQLNGMIDRLSAFGDGLYTRIDVLNNNLEKAATSQQAGIDALQGHIEKGSATSQDILKKMEVLDNIVYSINNVTELMEGEIRGLRAEIVNNLSTIASKYDEFGKTFVEVMDRDFRNELAGLRSELGSFKSEQSNASGTIQNTTTKFEGLLKQSADNLSTIGSKMRDLNNNYLESLGKIAGLAEGMKKGVEKVGEGLHGSMKELLGTMTKELGPLEKQYEKAFDNINRLTQRFDELNNRIKDMTKDIQKEFKDSFDRQAKVSDYTKDILENIKSYFEKQEVRYKEEQLMRRKKEGIDYFDRATLYYYRGNYELAINEINKALEIERTAEYLNLKGLILAESGRFPESQRTYDEALKLEPNLAEIHNNLGLLFLRMKRLDDAVISFQEAIKRNANYALAYVNLGKVLIGQERFDEAIKSYERALEIDPTIPEARDAIRLYKEGKIGE